MTFSAPSPPRMFSAELTKLRQRSLLARHFFLCRLVRAMSWHDVSFSSRHETSAPARREASSWTHDASLTTFSVSGASSLCP
eukprot:76411-Prymnesium_polylepis.1